MSFIRRNLEKMKLLFATFLIVVMQITPLAVISQPAVAVVAADPCSVYEQEDQQGANDEPGQKDLNILCYEASTPGSVDVAWNWDETGWSGNNTGDACALFDTNNDGNANYAVCVTVEGDPATQASQSPRIYECNDDRPDRCSGAVLQAGPYNTTCSVISDSQTDPFAGPAKKQKGADHPYDTQAVCTIDLSEVGLATALTDVCSFPSQQPNSDPSDCIRTATGGKSFVIEVIKDLYPADDQGKFSLSVEGIVEASAIGDGGSTGEITVADGDDVEIGETGVSGTALSDYNTTLACYDDEDPEAAAFYTSNPDGASSRSATIDFPGSESNQSSDVTCIFTNTRQLGTLKIVKDVINDDGGAKTYEDFTFKVNDGTAESFDESTSPDGEKSLSLPIGTYSVVEPEANTMGYETSYNNCTDVEVTLGQTTTCTITNDDIAPTLTLKKTVSNSNGGNAYADDWTLKAASNGGTLINEAGTPADQLTATTQTYDAIAGVAYTLSEHSGPSGYSASNWSCDGGSLQDDVLILDLDEDVTCEITNRDVAPQLTIIKDLTIDNGGSKDATDFVLRLNGGVYDGTKELKTGDTPAVVSNVAYTLSETEIFGYENKGVSCLDDVTQGVISHPVTLDEGQHVTCTISNDDIAPKLTVTKSVTNDDGGELQVSNFPLYVDGQLVVSGQQYTSFNAGDYDISEIPQEGYEFLGFSGDCLIDGSITLEVGGVYTCTLSNDDIPAKITVTKKVTNDDGGTAKVSDFTLKVNATEVTSDVENTFDGNLNVTISEQAKVDGYTNTSIECYDLTADDQFDLGSSFKTQLGHEYDCTVENDDNTPEITLVKIVENDYGTPADSNLWTLKATPEANQVGATTLSGDGNPNDGSGVLDEAAKAGVAYTLSEAGGADGYTPGDWECTGGNLNGDVLTLALGDDVICSITNEAEAPELKVIKHVINDDGGSKNASHFTMLVDGTGVSDSSFPGSESGVTVTLDAGSYNVTETGPDGYADSYSADCSGTIEIGEEKVCTITNDDIAPELRLEKTVINDNGGTAEPSDWYLKAWKKWSVAIQESPTNPSGSDEYSESATTNWHDVEAGTKYFLKEFNGPDGYEASEWECDGGQMGYHVTYGQYVILDLDEDVTCEIENDDIAPKIKVIKVTYPYQSEQDFDFEVTNKESEEATEGHFWNFTLDTDWSDGEFDQWEWIELETAGVVSIEEEQVDGWKTYISCNSYFPNLHPSGWLKQLDNPRNIYEDTVDIGDKLYCTFFNVELGDIEVTKFHDVNQNGYWDEGEPTLPDWEINLKKFSKYSYAGTESVVTDKNGVSVFENLIPSGYHTKHFYSLNETLQDGWFQTGLYCGENDIELDRLALNGFVQHSDGVSVEPGETTRCYIGNARDGSLTIEKDNNRVGQVLSPGDEIEFSILVNNPEDSGIVFDAIVYDLLPIGLTYVNGSGGAVSSVRGSLVDPLDASDYTGNVPATWELGDLAPGEQVLLTYSATVNEDISSGVYENVAYVEGQACTAVELDYFPTLITREVYDEIQQVRCPKGSVLSTIFGNGEEDPFVESAVQVSNPDEPDQGYVLGTLSDTGTPAILTVALGSLIAVVGVSLTRRKKMNLSKWLQGMGRSSAMLVLGLLVGGFMFVGSALAVNQLTVSQLATPTKQSALTLTYQVATTTSESFVVTLDVDGPGTNDYTVVKPLVNGSHSDSFQINMPVDGAYDVAVSTDTGLLNEQTITRDAAVPTAPVYNGVTREGNTYTLSFQAGSSTDTIKIYASTEKEFPADSTTLVDEVNGSATTFVYVASDDAQRFFAIQTVDAAGNTSPLVGDNEVVATNTPTPVTSTSDTSDDGTVSDEAAVTTADVAGTTDENTEDDDNSSQLAWVVAVLALILVGGGFVYAVNSTNKKSE